jgi:hypothetical protein
MDAIIELLLLTRYNLQTLSSSHYHVAEKNNSGNVFERYESTEEFKDFLRCRADAAQEHGGSTGGNTSTEDLVFTSYIFGTQGLDLAIPSPEFILKKMKKER